MTRQLLRGKGFLVTKKVRVEITKSAGRKGKKTSSDWKSRKKDTERPRQTHATENKLPDDIR